MDLRVKSSIAPVTHKSCEATSTHFQIYELAIARKSKKDCARIHQYAVVGWAQAEKNNLLAV